jgi:glycosyltransferase involved in cell wall biosynthesis
MQTKLERGDDPRQPVNRLKVLVFVVAYEAEATLEKVLARIPPQVFEFETEILVIDDSSRDRTFEVGLRSASRSAQRTTILYNSNNQGYGGNQKLGYAYALRHNFDFVVLLHGDGQYAPGCIPDLLQPLIDGRADAVLGSRMLRRGGALKGGMPLYKFLSNRILTRTQNVVLRSGLSEFHSGFRAYRVASLGRLPFQYNSNAFHFDTEIIIQLMLAGCRIQEVPIPTYYGEEICRVNGVRYAIDVVLATLASRLHRLGILYERKFDIEGPGNLHYRLKLGYRSSHTMALDAVRAGARVLDIGCGSGRFARELAKKSCRVVGVDKYLPAEPCVRELSALARGRALGSESARFRLRAAPRRHRAPEGTREVSRWSTACSTEPEGRAKVRDDRQRSVRNREAADAVRQLQLWQARNPRPDAYTLVHVQNIAVAV